MWQVRATFPSTGDSIMPNTSDKASAQNIVQEGAKKAENLMNTAMEKARDTAASVGQGTEQVLGSVGCGMRSLADTLQTTGKYLEEKDLQNIGSDIVELVRRNPIPSLFIGMGLGFMLARTFRS